MYQEKLTDKFWLILGGGAVVQEYYLPALKALNALENVIIVDTSLNNLKNLTQEAPNIKYQQADFREYLGNISNEDMFEAVIIALPNQFHVEAVKLALNKGLHVLCEKPLSTNAESCLKLQELSDETGKILAVGMVRRFLPSVSALKLALKNGLIGKLQKIDIQCGGPYGWLSDTGAFFQKENGGVLADMGVHYLDIVEDLVGKLNPISYYDDSQGGVEANCEFRLVAQDSIDIKLLLSRTHALKQTAIFQGDLGELILKLDTFDGCFWKSHDSDLNGKLSQPTPFQSGNWLPNFNSCFAEQFVEFALAINHNQPPRVSGRDAANTVGLIEWAYTQSQKLSQNIINYTVEQPITVNSKIIVTGGTGFIGERLIERLVSFGCSEIIVPVRNYKSCAGAARFPIQMPRVNLLDYEQVKKSIAGSRFVFHLAYGRDGANAADVTIEGTKNVVNAAIASSVECVVILSTMYVFGHPNTNQLVDESYPYNPTGGEYGTSKAKMEDWCLKIAKQQRNTRIVILNPSCVYGPGGKTYTKLPLDMARAGKFCWIESGKGIANYTFVENLIDAIILAANCVNAHGERFIINDGFCTWREFLTPLIGKYANLIPNYNRSELINKTGQKSAEIQDLIRHLLQDLELIDIINRMPILGTIKRQTFKLAPKFHQTLISESTQPSLREGLVTEQPLEYPPVWLADLFGTTITKFSSAKAAQILGWKPTITLFEGHKQTVSWLEKIGYIE